MKCADGQKRRWGVMEEGHGRGNRSRRGKKSGRGTREGGGRTLRCVEGQSDELVAWAKPKGEGPIVETVGRGKGGARVS